ncbi:MAG: methyl-accepting chemotaxis protein [Isosphaeraceae bacterium]
MMMRAEWILIGAAGSGAASAAALALANLAALPPSASMAAGVAVGASIGAASAWLGSARTGHRLADRVEAMAEPDDRRPPSTGWGPLDRVLDDLEGWLAQANRSQQELEELTDWVRETMPELGDDTGRGRGGSGSIVPECRRIVANLVRQIEKLGARADRMTAGADEQSAAVSRTASSVEALSDRIDRISRNAEEAAEAGRRGLEEARRGLEQIQGIIAGMDRLASHVDGNARKARRLGDRSDQIGSIVELIAGLSSRTDMLALNATIESVRAGEHGRGFAVVAEEIRKLAERAAESTREVGELVEAIRGDVQESVRALGDEQEEVEREAQRVREAGSALERIGQFAEHSARLVESISHSANDQVVATQDLVRAIQRISEVSRQIRGESQQVRDESRDLLGKPATPSPAPPAAAPASPPNGRPESARDARRARRPERAEAR